MPPDDDGGSVGAATRVVLRPLATPLPLGFLALVLATTAYSALQIGWIPAAQGRVAGLTAVVAAVLAATAVRFAVTGVHELTASAGWQAAAGWTGLAVALLALYAALALELEGARRRTVLPLGRRGLARGSVAGEEALDAGELAREPGVRPRL